MLPTIGKPGGEGMLLRGPSMMGLRCSFRTGTESKDIYKKTFGTLKWELLARVRQKRDGCVCDLS